MDWDDVQRTRLTCLERLEAATTPNQRSHQFTLRQMAAGEASRWMDPVQPSLLMIGEALATRASECADAGDLDDAGPAHERAA